MDIMKFNGYEATAELDMDRGVCRGKILFIDDLITFESDTPTGLTAAFQAAVEDYLVTCAELGIEPKKPLRGQFNVRIPPSVHRDATIRALKDSATLNDVVVRALQAYLNPFQQVEHQVKLVVKVDENRFVTAKASVSQPAEWRSTNVH